MRLGPIFLVGASLVACCVALGAFAWQGTLPHKGFPGSEVVVEIEAGQPAKVAAARLQHAGVIRSALLFRVLMRLRRAEEEIRAGEYAFSGEVTPSQVLDRLMRGDVVRHRLTVPEGLRADEVADLAENAGFGTAREFLSAASDPSLVRDIDSKAESLEGYLFPDTYYFARATPGARVVAEMVARFRQEMTPERLARLGHLGLSLREAVILASMIEEEARVDEERPRISAVFHNRLRAGMLLQCDPTVVYALVRDGRYRGDIYRSDLAYKSPWNTYVNSGLPPGPICSPGSRSIDAALHPASTNDLYFVVSGPGTHQFSSNMRDHENAVRRYRRDFLLRRR